MEWKPVKGYEGLYEISSNGDVKSIRKNRVLKPVGKQETYLRIHLCPLKGERKQFLIHRLVAENFIPNPQNKPQVNHIDGDKGNNKLSNLEWVSISENRIHSYKLGLNKKGEDHVSSKLTQKQVDEIKRRLKDGEGVVFLSKEFGVSHQLISKIKNNKAWR